MEKYELLDFYYDSESVDSDANVSVTSQFHKWQSATADTIQMDQKEGIEGKRLKSFKVVHMATNSIKRDGVIHESLFVMIQWKHN